jgi:Domain of unknown function (DUF5666)
MQTQPLRSTSFVTALAAALLLAACGSGSSPSTGGTPTAVTLSRGAVTAKAAGAITVNGVVLSTAGVTAVKVDDNPAGTLDDVHPGDVVRVKGSMDDRTGTATEIEVEHALEGRVDDKGTDFIVVGGARVQVDDSTHLDDRFGGFDGVGIGSIVRVSGSPVVDDRGGLRASRLDRSPRADDGIAANDDDVDAKGFVKSLDTGAKTFRLLSSPDATSWYEVDYSAIALPAGVVADAYVEVHTTTAPVAGTLPVLATLKASGIHVEDGFAGAEAEVEGYVTTIVGTSFVVGGVTVQTSASTVYKAGCPGAPWVSGCPSNEAGDLVIGAKLEAEGPVDAAGVLHARKVTFEAGVRITADVAGYTGTDLTLLGVPVQIPSWIRNDLSVAIANGVHVEVRGQLTADGNGIVAHRIKDPTGNATRVFIRAVVTAKGTESLTVLGFAVSTSGASLQDVSDAPVTNRSAWFASITPGHTVVKVRANSAADVNTGLKTWTADEVEVEGDD